MEHKAKSPTVKTASASKLEDIKLAGNVWGDLFPPMFYLLAQCKQREKSHCREILQKDDALNKSQRLDPSRKCTARFYC